MRDFEYDLSQVYHHRFRVEQAAAELKAMRQAPPNTYPWRHIRAAEHNYNAWRSHLSMAENILRKFHPDQPRVPAGNPDGGQWTDGGGGSRPGSNDPLSPARTDLFRDQAGDQPFKARLVVRSRCGAGNRRTTPPPPTRQRSSGFIIQRHSGRGSRAL